jgi:hypothetical protein
MDMGCGKVGDLMQAVLSTAVVQYMQASRWLSEPMVGTIQPASCQVATSSRILTELRGFALVSWTDDWIRAKLPCRGIARSLTLLGPGCCSEIDPPRNRISDVTSSMAGAIASGLGTPVMFVRHAQSTNNPVYEGACAFLR